MIFERWEIQRRTWQHLEIAFAGIGGAEKGSEGPGRRYDLDVFV